MLTTPYTSSGRWRGAAPKTPAGVIEFDEQEAARLNQRAFHIDLSCLARVPLLPTWLTDWDKPHHGVIAVAGKAVKDRVLKEAEGLAKSCPEIIDVRGLGSGTKKTARRPP